MTRLRRCWQERRSLVAPLIVPELEAPDVKLKMPCVRSPLHHQLCPRKDRVAGSAGFPVPGTSPRATCIAPTGHGSTETL